VTSSDSIKAVLLARATDEVLSTPLRRLAVPVYSLCSPAIALIAVVAPFFGLKGAALSAAAFLAILLPPAIFLRLRALAFRDHVVAASGRACPVCLYDLAALDSPICPECGENLRLHAMPARSTYHRT
jgi:ABC-type transport system involved in cytochrome bd biosynthesis fused ATPase/permease subunit